MKLLFVCLGNICRSPSAEGVMKALVKKNGLDKSISCDSCGTIAQHEGEEADHRMQTHAERRGYALTSIARGFRNDEDFKNFDYILTMDHSNYQDILSFDRNKNFHEKVIKMTDFCQNIEADEVPDPYYGGPDGFEKVLDLLEDACQGLLDKIKKEL